MIDRKFEEIGFLTPCNTWFALGQEDYEKVKKLNEMTTEQIRKLNLKSLSSPELTYLSNVELVEGIYELHSDRYGPPDYYIWTNNERKPFDMNRIPRRLPNENAMSSIIFDLPPRFKKEITDEKRS